MLKALGAKKKLFVEPRTATAVEEVLARYSEACEGSAEASGTSGGLLLSVVGGKMAEGINFGDNLGRQGPLSHPSSGFPKGGIGP